ncbi:hypothetical protein CQA86_16790, partial [Klebsiella pneumoniae]
ATLAEIPTTTPASDALSKALKKRGFKFVGSTICRDGQRLSCPAGRQPVYC